MLSNIFNGFKDYILLEERLGKEKLQVVGLTETGHLLLAHKLSLERPVLALFATPEEAKGFYQQCVESFGTSEILYYPAAPYLPFQVLASSKDAVRQRAAVLHRLAAGKKLLVVAPIEALAWKVAKGENLAGRALEFKVGTKTELVENLSDLITFGYERVDMVSAKGEFAKRGGILDIFSPGEVYPVRIELWGDEVDSIRTFEPETQRSLESVQSCIIYPGNEMGVTPLELRQATERLQKELSAHKGRLAKLQDKAGQKSIEEQVIPFIEAFKQGNFKEGSEQFYYLLDTPKVNLCTYFSAGAVLLYDNKKIMDTLVKIMKDKEMALADYLASGLTLPGFAKNSWTLEEVKESIGSANPVELAYIPQGTTPNFSFFTKEVVTFNGDSIRLKAGISAWQKKGYSIIFTAAHPEQGRRLQSFLKDLDYHISILGDESFPLNPSGCYLAIGYDLRGMEWPALNIVFVSDRDVFGIVKKKRLTKQRSGQKIASFLELKVGDYVVHTNHGIGIYQGVEKITALGVERDYLVIHYAGTDKLYVPTDQVERVQKFIGAEGHNPKLNKLGNADWAKAKSRIKESVQEMAKELLALHAERQALPGFAFPADTPWQREFEDAFPFEETPDQERAIAEIKADMEKMMPMDRLLCGDVGYGKTEVAMRAAFKAVNAGKQVAVLVPTTVLAQQHEQTFHERFTKHGLVVNSLSRFKSPKEQKLIIESVKIGTTDILIGTHRILSKDIRFKDLGLLIVDEEQRFGVAHKERLKQLRTNVDVLTLTATPIPRTLHMSLVGMRDMSLIETPPVDRLPVQTYVLEYNERVVEEAIAAEISRGGQVFFVHNRVQDMRRFAQKAKAFAPETNFAIAHGQMREDELEDAMQEFVSGQAEVLITTTIIESGLDMPNVNTLIIDEADKMGLSQLYQLRGRVGRSSRQAYAYITYRRDKILTDIAQKRLKAIRDFTELGSGFKIAMRDLELRGAGNILGPEQHGNIITVGFEMYVRLLEEAVEELRGVNRQEKEPVAFDLPISVSLPDSYVLDSGIKTEIYQRLLATISGEEVDSIREETEDRFGNLPPQTENLFVLSSLRVKAQKLAVRSVSYKSNLITISFTGQINFSPVMLEPLIKKYGRNLEFAFQTHTELRLKLHTTSEKEILKALTDFFDILDTVVS